MPPIEVSRGRELREKEFLAFKAAEAGIGQAELREQLGIKCSRAVGISGLGHSGEEIYPVEPGWQNFDG